MTRMRTHAITAAIAVGASPVRVRAALVIRTVAAAPDPARATTEPLVFDRLAARQAWSDFLLRGGR